MFADKIKLMIVLVQMFWKTLCNLIMYFFLETHSHCLYKIKKFYKAYQIQMASYHS